MASVVVVLRAASDFAQSEYFVRRLRVGTVSGPVRVAIVALHTRSDTIGGTYEAVGTGRSARAGE